MLKIYNNIQNIGQVYDSISSAYLDYAPIDKFRETNDPEEADIVLLNGVISPIQNLSVNIFNGALGLFNVAKVGSISKGVASAKGRIIWLDTMGPKINRAENIYAGAAFRDNDIVISPATIPERPNLFTHLFHVEKSVFHKYERFERVPGSVMVSHDNLFPETDWINGIMDAVSELHVTKKDAISPDVADALQENISKVSVAMLPYPKGIAYEASQCEFVLHTHTTLGVEMMGIEAGMCGCQPIYPDTEFYRDIFDDTGVVFYDTDNAVDSLKTIISEGASWSDEQIEAFRSKFSAEDNLPAFWDHVSQLYA